MKNVFSQNAMARSMYGFSIKPEENIVDAAERAVNCIYSAGLAFWDGALGSGSNSALAYYAAEAFEGKLDELKGAGTEKAAFFADIIQTQQDYLALDDQSYSNPDACQKLQDIYDAVNDPQQNTIGWVPSAQPSSYDGNGRYISPPSNRPQP